MSASELSKLEQELIDVDQPLTTVSPNLEYINSDTGEEVETGDSLLDAVVAA